VREENQSIRNDNLRLTLSGHEKEYIAKALIKARRRVKIWAILSLVCIAVALSVWGLNHFDAMPPRDMFQNTLVAGLLSWLAICFAAILRLLFAVFNYRKFCVFRDDHDKFLRKYHRAV